MRSATPIHVVWFKRDLRVSDHRPLCEAARRGPVLPLFVVEPEWWGEPDMSARQYAFMAACVAELAAALARLGQPLMVRVGDVRAVLEEIAATVPIAGLWSHEETGGAWTYARDVRVKDWAAHSGVAWHEFRQDGVVRRLKSRDGWAKRWDQMMAADQVGEPEALTPLPPKITHALPSHTLPSASDLKFGDSTPCAERQAGGRDAALSALYTFLNERGETYRSAMSSPVSGEYACSRLSPYLAWGAVSMREVAQATWLRQREIKSTKPANAAFWRSSLISFTGRLHWHCHFMQKLEDEPRLETENLHRVYDGVRRSEESDAALLSAWRAGETGLPFVDACMRMLAATGWMNFRMRAMLMAVASYHLWLHWREPGLHLARLFTDYEPGIHWPQVQMQSGTTGINTVRIYNPIKQGYDQDPSGDFVRKWVPELATIAGPSVHEPWKAPEATRILDKTYPMPVVDHIEAARAARQKIYGVRKGAAFRETADAIQDRHGSRKSGIAMRGQTGKRGRSRSSSPSQQMTLNFDDGSAQ